MNIISEFEKTAFIFDRFGGDVLSLPYNLEQIKIAANDSATASLINTKFSYLYENLMYIYRACKISSSLIPISSTGIAGVSSNSNIFTWHFNLSSSQFIPISSSQDFIGLDNVLVMSGINNIASNNYSILASNGDDLVGINSTSDNSTINVVFSTKEYNPDYNLGIQFKNINDIFYDNNTLYVSDLSTNLIYKYDASGFNSNDSVLLNRLFFKKLIGGKGTIYDRYEFQGPRGITTYNNDVYVLDSGNGCIKKYDSNLNWLQTFNLVRDLLSAYPISLISTSDGKFLTLTKSNKIIVYNNDFNSKQIYNIANQRENNEVFLSLKRSATDTNIFYLISNKNVYKRFISNPKYNIGKYLFYSHNIDTSPTITSFLSLSSYNGDNNIVFGKSGNTGIFMSFFDNINLYDILSIPDFDIYSLDQIQVNEEEYMQSWVFNKSLSKMLLNIMRLRDQIIGKFMFSRDYRSNIVFDFTRYLTPEERSSIYFNSTFENFIGLNEIFTNSVVNRCLEKLYNYQYNILEILKEDTIRTPLSGTIINLG